MTSLRKPLALAAVLTLLAALPLAAQTPAVQHILARRITAPIDNATRSTLAGSRPPLADPARDLGAVAPSLALHGIELVFSRSAQQETALQTLIAAQQNPASPLFHQWLSPEQFAAQFGVADADIATTEAWLEQQGFSIDAVARSRNSIYFSGTAAQVAAAFGTPLHNFSAPDGSTRFAPAADLTLPSALASSVLAVGNLSSFHLKPRLKLAPQSVTAPSTAQASGEPTPLFTSSVSGSHFLQPGDVAVQYDVKPVYTAGYNGANQSIAVVGQSLIYLSDIANFTAAAGITARTPILVLEPGSGAAAVSAGDEGESDLDVEYSSAMAPGAQVYFVFTGNSANYGVFNAIQYAVTEKIAPIISSSYGACEIALGSTNIATLDQTFAQAVAQGQTILSSAGDSGSTDCYGDYSTGSASNYQVAVDYPASSPYVTAMGGAEIPTAASASTNSTYFTPANGSDIVTSLKSYVPEQVWNDDVAAVASAAPASGGGGVSIYELHPSWQTGTIGGVAIPSSAYRLLPDISLVASNYSAPLLFCTSDTSDWVSGQTHSCNSGFRDSSTNDVTAAGGTSFDSPIFAGLLALIEQKVNAATATSAGLGNINPTLYSLAANSVTYGNAFHDIATGGNQCLSGATICGTSTASTSYAATTGYDQASGLGSIDLYNLLNAWPTTAASLLSETTTALTAATTAPLLNATDVVTITVAQYNPAGGASTTPTGTVSLLLDGSSAGTVTLSSGVASYTFTAASSGSHVLVATYSGDTTHAASTSTLVLTIGAPFTLSVPTVTITSLGGSANSTLTVTPIAGYTGTVNVTITSYSANLTNLCINDALNGVLKVTGSAPVVDAITVISNGTTCGTNAFNKLGSGKIKLGSSHAIATNHAPTTPPATPTTPWRKAPTAFAAFLLVLAISGRRSRLLRGKLTRAGLALGFVALLSAGGLGLSGCSNNAAASPTLTDTPAGTYTVTLTGTDSVNASLTTTTTFTIVVQ